MLLELDVVVVRVVLVDVLVVEVDELVVEVVVGAEAILKLSKTKVPGVATLANSIAESCGTKRLTFIGLAALVQLVQVLPSDE